MSPSSGYHLSARPPYSCTATSVIVGSDEFFLGCRAESFGHVASCCVARPEVFLRLLGREASCGLMFCNTWCRLAAAATVPNAKLHSGTPPTLFFSTQERVWCFNAATGACFGRRELPLLFSLAMCPEFLTPTRQKMSCGRWRGPQRRLGSQLQVVALPL